MLYGDSLNYPKSESVSYKGLFKRRVSSRVTMWISQTLTPDIQIINAFLQKVYSEMWLLLGFAMGANCPAGDTVDFPDNSNHFLPSREYEKCSGIKTVIINEGITKVGIYAFHECGNIEDISFPSTLIELQEGAFKSCKKLAAITLPDSIQVLDRYVFQDTALTNATLPISLKTFTGFVFRECTKITNIYLKMESAYYDVYNNCSVYLKGFKELIYMPAAVTVQEFHPNTTIIADLALSYCNEFGLELVLPDAVTTLRGQITYGCWYLENVSMGCNVIEIKDDAFLRATNLRRIDMRGASSKYQTFDGMLFTVHLEKMILCPEGRRDTAVTIPKNLTSFAYAAFAGNNARCQTFVLEEGSKYVTCGVNDSMIYTQDGKKLIRVAHAYTGVLTIPDGTVYIDTGAVYWSRMITEVFFPETVVEIGPFAFASGINAVYHLPSSLRYIGNNALSGGSVEHVDIPEGITEITPSCFRGAGLRTVTLPESLLYIRGYAFSKTQSLGHVILPKYLKTIESYAFDDSTVTNITLPELQLHELGEGCFFNCLGLRGVMVIPMCVANIRKKAFGQCTNIETTLIKNCATFVAHEAFFAVPNMQITCEATRPFTIYHHVVSSEHVFSLCANILMGLLLV